MKEIKPNEILDFMEEVKDGGIVSLIRRAGEMVKKKENLDKRLLLQELILEFSKVNRWDWEKWGMEPAMEKNSNCNYVWSYDIEEILEKKLKELDSD